MSQAYSEVERCVDATLAVVGKKVVLAAPLGLGKPNQLMNAFYRKACDDPSIELDILTALSLEKPKASSALEANFLEPFVTRQFGDYEPLQYMQALRAGSLPSNIRVSEFYFKAGSMKNILSAQCNYISTNYTFVARDLLARGVNVLVQLVAEAQVDGEQMLSLSSNTDVTLDLVPLLKDGYSANRPVVTIAQVHDDMPFMYNKAAVRPSYFDMVVRNKKYNTALFATPNTSVSAAEFMLGFRASTLIKDGGTLQIGIGALADAITHSCELRQNHNKSYQAFAREAGFDEQLTEQEGGLAGFEKGLYGCSEMFVNGFLHMMRAGIMKRAVYEHQGLQELINKGLIADAVKPETLSILVDAGLISKCLSVDDVAFLVHWGIFKSKVQYMGDKLIYEELSFTSDLSEEKNLKAICENILGDKLKHGIILHGGFFLGPKDFYQALRDLSEEENKKICMDSVRRINRIDDEPLQSAQRQHARFINTGMMVTLGGAVVSDGLDNGQVISGVGGQYNFVAQAHELQGARSIICVRSTRGSGDDAISNIVTHYGHTTIPRHLRDIVVTEYGVADLRAKTDAEIIKALLNVADSRFQAELQAYAMATGKIEADYEIPAAHRNNTPEKNAALVKKWQKLGFFPAFPLGCDFTEEEIALSSSLRDIKALQKEPTSMLKAVVRSLLHDSDEEEARPYLERIGLDHPESPKEMVLQQLLLLELEENGYLRPL